ncbi:Uncharacterised protein [uncultured archaeon]|nr:Uncharacterised protein [uncultured archaeon]
MLKIQTIEDGGKGGDGYRLLVTAEWPVRFPESGADGFNPKLAPSPALYEELKSHKIGFEPFALKYAQELAGQKERLQKLSKQAKDFDVILITYPDFEGRSIGQILLDAITQAGPPAESGKP